MVDAIQIQRLYESRTFTFILCNEIIWGLKGERMDIREKIARIWRDGGSSWNINKKVEKTLALPELDEHYRAKGCQHYLFRFR